MPGLISAPRRRGSLPPVYQWGQQQQQQNPFQEMGMQMLQNFQSLLGGQMSPDAMFAAESAPIKSRFKEAGERSRSRLAAIGGGGNVRAIQSGEKELATAESESLQKLKSQIGERAMARQAMGVSMLEMLKKLLGPAFGMQQGAGHPYYGRP